MVAPFPGEFSIDDTGEYTTDVHNDRYLFEKHVDLERLTRLVIDDFLDAEIQDLKNEPMGPLEQLGAGLGLSFAQLIKPRMVDEIQYAITRGVESGSLERGDLKAERRPATEEGGLGEALAKLSEEFPNLKPMGRGTITRKGGTASVALSVQLVDDLPGEAPTHTLLVRFVRTPDRYWRATEIENFREVLRAWRDRQSKRLDLANEPVRKMIGQTVSVVETTKEQGLNGFGGKDVWVVATLKNHASAAVEGIEADVTIRDAGGELKKVRVQDIDPIPPGETERKVWSLGLDLSDNIDRQIYDIDPSRLTITVDIRHLALSDGREIKVAESLEEVENKPSPREPPASATQPLVAL